MEIFLISLTAFIGSLLTFFSGFGLGTLLTPVFILFFPIEIAIALTGVVHLLNNLFKMTLIGRNANWKIVLRFGIPAIFSALLGAYILSYFSSINQTFDYQILEWNISTTPVKIVISVIMLLFTFLEFSKKFNELQFSEKHLTTGGLLSGFFGGISGHQGALRSAFLTKCNLSKESFIATGIVIASIIDISRLGMYFSRFKSVIKEENISILASAILSAFVGALLGKQLLKKITINIVNKTVSVMIILISILLGLGII